MTYTPQKPKEWLSFKQCENTGCGRWRLKWQIKKQRIWIRQIKQFVEGQLLICGHCKKTVENAIKERNI